MFDEDAIEEREKACSIAHAMVVSIVDDDGKNSSAIGRLVASIADELTKLNDSGLASIDVLYELKLDRTGEN